MPPVPPWRGRGTRGPRLDPYRCRYYEKVESATAEEQAQHVRRYEQCYGNPVHDGLCFNHWAKAYSTLKEFFDQSKSDDESSE